MRPIITGCGANAKWFQTAGRNEYQSGLEGSENGGNGFLRMVTIDPGAGTISVKAYSPYVDAYKTAADQQFVFENVRF